MSNSLLDSRNDGALIVERGRQMRLVVQHDISQGMSLEGAIESLATHLGIQVESVRLAIAIANDADGGAS